jgi:hypothetical protein
MDTDNAARGIAHFKTVHQRNGRRSMETFDTEDEAAGNEYVRHLNQRSADQRKGRWQPVVYGFFATRTYDRCSVIGSKRLGSMTDFAPKRQRKMVFYRYFESGSDGTRTRDLRRERPNPERDRGQVLHCTG